MSFSISLTTTGVFSSSFPLFLSWRPSVRLTFSFSLFLTVCVQMAITDAHIPICKTNHLPPSFLHYMENNFRRLENCCGLIIHHNKHKSLYLVSSKFLFHPRFIVPEVECFPIKSPHTPQEQREICH